MEYLSQKI